MSVNSQISVDQLLAIDIVLLQWVSVIQLVHQLVAGAFCCCGDATATVIVVEEVESSLFVSADCSPIAI